MKLQSLQVKNYKGFRDSGNVEFGPGFNVIVGQNNSGKTALIEAVRLHRAGNQPYRGKGNSEESQTYLESHFISKQTILKKDLIKATMKLVSDFLPEPQNTNKYKKSINELEINYLILEEFGSGEINLIEISPQSPNTDSEIKISSNDKIDHLFSLINLSADIAVNNRIELFKSIEIEAILFLNPQRNTIAKSHTSGSHELTPDALNLPVALHGFQGTRPQEFRRLVNNLTQIFPTIEDLTVSLIPSRSEVEIIIWPEGHTDNAREAISLDKCGTGISQALAILLTAAQPDEKIIAIDEISSFLHPMAIKNLIRILKQQYSRHQYIISTHYTDVIAWAEPDKIILTQKKDNECRAFNISLEDVEDFEILAGELGISMADVFGSDRIIWVEGETEEQCFPLLFNHLGRSLPKGTNIAKIIGTGNLSLKNKNVSMIFDIYEKVSRMASPLTRACVFTMDRETMSDQDVKTLKDKAKDNLLILNRRCYENYLLWPSAIAELLTSLGETVTEAKVEGWLIKNGGNETYGAAHQWNGSLLEEAWLIKIDGAKLLEDMVPELSETRHTYRKTTHSPQLTKLLLNQDPGTLSELMDFAKSIIDLINSPKQ